MSIAYRSCPEELTNVDCFLHLHELPQKVLSTLVHVLSLTQGARGLPRHTPIVHGGTHDHPLHKLVVCGAPKERHLPDSRREWMLASQLISRSETNFRGKKNYELTARHKRVCPIPRSQDEKLALTHCLSTSVPILDHRNTNNQVWILLRTWSLYSLELDNLSYTF